MKNEGVSERISLLLEPLRTKKNKRPLLKGKSIAGNKDGIIGAFLALCNRKNGASDVLRGDMQFRQ